MRKRNFNRHTVTVGIPVTKGGVESWEYFSVKGLVQPPRETNDFLLKPSATIYEDYLEFYTKYDVSWGSTVDFPVFVWQNYDDVRSNLSKPYEIIKTRDFIKYGKDTYFKYVGYFNSDHDWGSGRGRPSDPNWSEISEFVQAVDSVEIVIDMKLSKIIE